MKKSQLTSPNIGEIWKEEEEEEEEEEEQVEEEELDDGIQSVDSLSSTPTGVETPDVIDLRKQQRKEPEKPLYQGRRGFHFASISVLFLMIVIMLL